MRKLNKGKKLSMRTGPRKILLRNLANNFFEYEKIQTSQVKAKVLQSIIEKMITRAKVDTIANRRLLARDLSPKILKKLFSQIAPEYKERSGGYSRITKLGPRISDGASIAIIELIKK